MALIYIVTSIAFYTLINLSHSAFPIIPQGLRFLVHTMASLFEENDAEELELLGLILKVKDGKRLVSFLAYETASNQFEDWSLPAVLNSVETYQFLGFEIGIAEELYRRFMGPSFGGLSISFEEFAIAHTERSSEDYESALDPYFKVMHGLGISQDLQ